MRLDGPPEPIKREDLRSECLCCGGSGRTPQPRLSAVRQFNPPDTMLYQGPCRSCAGAGKLKPRKVYQ